MLYFSKKTANLKLTELSELLTAMSYVSFFKNIPDLLSQPAGIAALASLGIHGAIAFLLPLMPVESSKSTKQAAISKPIGLLDLNAAEQSRLPQKTPVQTGVQAKLPPLPGQIAALPAQQQIPFNLANTPPAPPSGSTPLAALPPLPQNPGFNISPLPKSSSYQMNRKDLLIDPSFKSNSPSAAFSRNTSARSQRYNSDIAYGQPRAMPSSLPEVASAGVPSNLNAYPARLPLPTEAALPPMANNGSAVEPNPSATVAPVTPGNFVTPTGQMPKTGEGNFAFAQSGMQPFKVAPAQGTLLAGTNAVATAPAGIAAPSSSNPALGSGSYTQNQRQTISLLDSSSQFKTQYPKGRFHPPIRITMDKSKVDQNVDVTVSMDRQGKTEVNFLGDTSSISSGSKLAIRDRLLQYFKENSISANGQGDFYSFNISPNGGNTIPSDQNLSSQSGKLPIQPQLGNNQLPSAQQGTTKPFSRVEPNNQPDSTTTPQQNSQSTTQQTPAASLPPFKLRAESQTSLQSVPITQASQKRLVAKLLHGRENQQSSVNSSQSLIQKLRQAKQERENTTSNQ